MSCDLKELILATTNTGKVKELEQMLAETGVQVKGLAQLAEAYPEAPETGATFAENARQKALYYGELTGAWVLADDSGLEIDALNGAPGIYSARYSGVDGDRPVRDQANNEKVLRELAQTPDSQRQARFRCCLCLARGKDVMAEVTGTLEGVIAHEPLGSNGFGYDPLMHVPSLGKRVAQLDSETKNRISHRGQALARLIELLPRFIATT